MVAGMIVSTMAYVFVVVVFFFQAEDGIRDDLVTGVQTCALPIFISAIHLTDVDRLRGYEMGAVDYVPVPVVPEVLRAKVRVFAELFRKTRQLEQLNLELERRVAERTAQLKSSTARLLQSEQLRSLALAAGQMGSWDWDAVSGEFSWDEGQCRIFGVDPGSFTITPDNVRALIEPEDWGRLRAALASVTEDGQTFQTEFR